MANPTVSVDFEVDTNDLEAGLKRVSDELKKNTLDFKANTAGMDDWKNSSDGLRNKLTQLQTQLSLQRKALDAIQAKYDSVVDSQGANSAAAKKWGNDLLRAKANVAGTEKSIRKYTQSLNALEQETAEADNKNEKLNRGLRNLKSASKEADQGFTVLRGTLSQLITRTLVSLVQSLSSAISSARELRKEMGMLEATASTTGASFDTAKKNLIEVSAITDDTGAAVEGLNNLMSAGFDGAALDKITEELTGASIKWKDTLKFEGLADGLQETLATGKAIGPFAELLDRAGYSQEYFNLQLAGAKTPAEKQQVVLDTLAKFGLAEVKDAYEGINGSLVENNKAAAANQIALAELNKVIEPISTALLNLGTAIISHILPAIEKFSGALTKLFSGDFKGAAQDFISIWESIRTKVVNTVTDLAARIPELLTTLIDAVASHYVKLVSKTEEILPKIIETFLNVFNGIVERIPQIVQQVADALVAMLPLMVSGSVTLLNGIVDALPTVLDNLLGALPRIIDTISQLLSDSIPIVMNAAIKLFHGIVDAIPIVLESLIKALPDIITSLVNFIFENVPVVLDAAIDLLMAIVEAIPELIVNLVAQLPRIIIAIVDGLANGAPKIFEAAANILMSIVEAIPTLLVQLVKNVPTIITTIVEQLFKGVPELFKTGVDMMKGFLNGIVSYFATILKRITEFFVELVNNVKKFFGINSPSTVFADIGKNLMQGLWNGIKSLTDTIVKNVTNFGKNMVNGLKNSISNIAAQGKSFANKLWSGVSSVSSSVVNKVKGFGQKLVSGVKNGISGIKNVGENLVKGVWNGINSWSNWLSGKIKSWAGSIVTWAKKALGIASPSKIMRDQVGKMVGEGVGLGILDSTKDVMKDISKFSSSVVNGMTGNLSQLNAGLNGYAVAGASGGGVGGTVNNFYQTINAPKSPSRKDIYRDTRNLLALKGGN